MKAAAAAAEHVTSNVLGFIKMILSFSRNTLPTSPATEGMERATE